VILAKSALTGSVSLDRYPSVHPEWLPAIKDVPTSGKMLPIAEVAVGPVPPILIVMRGCVIVRSGISQME
jgi:hypothetical protein